MKKKLLIYFIGNFGVKILSLIMVPLYTAYISPRDFGTYDFWMTIVNFMTIIVSLHIYDAVYTNILKINNSVKNVYQRREELESEVKLLMNIMFIQTLIMLLVLCLIFKFDNDNKYLFYSMLIILLSVIYSNLNQGIARGFEENILMALSGFLIAFFSLSITIYLIKYDTIFKLDSIISLFWGQIIGLIVANTYLIFNLYKKGIIKNFIFKSIKKEKIKEKIKRILIFSLPMVPNSISWWIMNVSDRYLIVKFLSAFENGLYAMANKLPSLIFMVNTIYALAWQDEAIKLSVKSGDSKIYSRQLSLYIYLQFIFLLIFTISLPIFSPYLLKREYSEALVYIPLLTLAAVFSGISSFYGTFYLSTGRTKGAFYTSFWGAIVNLLFNVIFIKSLGLYAPVLGTISSFLVMLILRSVEFSKILKIKFPIFTLLFFLSIFFIIYILMYL